VIRNLLFLIFILAGSLSYGISFSVSGSSAPADVSSNTVKIYAGWANPGSACTSATETCNTCATSSTTRSACNQNSIHSGLYLTIDVSSNTSGISGQTVFIQNSDSETLTGVTNTASSTATSSGYSVKVLWSELCASGDLFNGACTSTSTTQGPQAVKSFKMGVKKSDGTAIETVTVELYLSIFNTGATTSYEPCTVNDDGTITDGASSQLDGACDYGLYPGDQKVFIDQFGTDWGGSTPSLGNSMPVDSVIFIPKLHATSNEATLDSITLNDISSNAYQIKVKDDASDPLEDSKLTDLNNDSKYCFIMGTMDRSGTIQRFTPKSTDTLLSTSGATARTRQIANACATPSEVAGVLKDKNCFIATAAFGSRLDPHVQRFREFRNF